jgi:hypothetical protein
MTTADALAAPAARLEARRQRRRSKCGCNRAATRSRAAHPYACVRGLAIRGEVGDGRGSWRRGLVPRLLRHPQLRSCACGSSP